MKHLIKKNRWECLLYSFAMALDLEPSVITSRLGHDGSEIVNPELAEPQGRLGFHVQEFTPLALDMGKSVTPFEITPLSLVGDKPFIVGTEDARDRRNMFFAFMIENSRGVITGRNFSGSHHAVAFEKDMIYDPDGPIYKAGYDSFAARHYIPICAWVVK